MSDRKKRLEEIQRTISDHVLRLQLLSVQFANMMADDAWEDNDELPSLDALSAFLLWLMRGDVSPGIGSNGRGSITAFYRDGDIKHTIDFLPSGKTAMSDMPERIWVWRNEPGNEVVISVPDQPYPTGSPEYVRKDIADAAVKAERERIATMIEATSYTVTGTVRSLEPVSPAFVGMDMHHATIAAAIRKGEQP